MPEMHCSSYYFDLRGHLPSSLQYTSPSHSLQNHSTPSWSPLSARSDPADESAARQYTCQASRHQKSAHQISETSTLHGGLPFNTRVPASKICFRDSPTRFTMGPSLVTSICKLMCHWPRPLAPCRRSTSS